MKESRVQSRESEARAAARRRGFTLLEAVVSTLFVGLMLVAALKTVSSTVRARQIQVGQRQGPALARQLMSEILQTRYLDPGPTPIFGPETGEGTGTRSAFNDVDDYNAWSESPPQLKDGTQLTDYSAWTRGVSVAFVSRADPNSTSGTETGLKRITVTVTDPAGVQTVLMALRSSGGAADQQPAIQATYITWVGVDFQSGSGTSTIRSGTNPLSQEGTNAF